MIDETAREKISWARTMQIYYVHIYSIMHMIYMHVFI